MQLSERISELLFKRLEGTLSYDEKQELEYWRGESTENEDLFNELTDKESIPELMKDFARHKESVWNKLLEKALELKEPPVKKMRLWNLAAAVAAIIIVVMTLYY